jgi:hypothetical protein
MVRDVMGISYQGAYRTLTHRAITHDEQVHSEPSEFNPGRFMGPNPEPDPEAVFGFGRCVAKRMGVDVLYRSSRVIGGCALDASSLWKRCGS